MLSLFSYGLIACLHGGLHVDQCFSSSRKVHFQRHLIFTVSIMNVNLLKVSSSNIVKNVLFFK